MGTRILGRSFFTFLLFSIIVVRFLTIPVRLAKMVRSLQHPHGPLLVAFCVAMSGALLYLKLTIEAAFTAYHLLGVSRNPFPSFGDMVSLVLNVFRFLEFR